MEWVDKVEEVEVEVLDKVEDELQRVVKEEGFVAREEADLLLLLHMPGIFCLKN